MKYREKSKISVTVDAFLWKGEAAEEIKGPDWMIEAMKKTTISIGAIWISAEFGTHQIQIRNLNGGVSVALPGSYIVRRMGGEIYPMDSGTFEFTYEKEEA